VLEIRGPRTTRTNQRTPRRRTGQCVEAVEGRRPRTCGAIGCRSQELVRNVGQMSRVPDPCIPGLLTHIVRMGSQPPNPDVENPRSLVYHAAQR
jgi:hypothetical protein